MARYKDPLEQIAQKGVRHQHQPDDDWVSYIMEAPDGEKKSIFDIVRKIVFTGPDGNGLPMVQAQRIYKLDDTGRPFGDVKSVGKCSFGCWVRKLHPCAHCHQEICQNHALLAGGRVYCRRRPCSIFGRLRQVRLIFIIIFRIFFGPMMVSRKVEKKEIVIASEKDFFAEPEERESLSILERGSDDSDY